MKQKHKEICRNHDEQFVLWDSFTLLGLLFVRVDMANDNYWATDSNLGGGGYFINKV